MGSLRISVFASRELQALVARLKETDRETRKAIRQVTKAEATPIWAESVASNVTTRLESVVLGNTARVRVSDQNVTLSSATVGRRLRGGLNPKTDAKALEFGALDREQTSTYKATRGGKTFTVTRHARRQLRQRNRQGYVVYAAAAEAIPRLASLWAQTAVRTLHELIEGG